MADEHVVCPYCNHKQPAAVYCGRCRVHIQHYGGVKSAIARFEADLGQMRTHVQAAAPTYQPALDALRSLGEALLGLKVNVERLSRSQREMTTLAQVGRMINSVLTMDKLLNLIMDMVINAMFAERGLLMLKDAVTGDLTVQAARNMTMESESETKSRLTISTNICSRVASEGKPILATDAQNEDQFHGMHSVMAYNLASLVCVPMKTKSGEVIGVIYVDNRIVSGAFNEDSVELLTNIANQAAVAIENAWLYESIQKETNVRMSLQRYLSPSVVEDLMKGKEGTLKLGGAKLDCSVLFADICGFTPLSESLDPEHVVRFLNEYFTAMTDIVFRHHGTLDKFIGDAIMAVFGAPMAMSDHACKAVTAAIEMQREAKRLQEEAEKKGRTGFHLRIGINSGPVIAGNIGSPSRLDYTVIGDTVNVASRLEPLASTDGIVISDATYQQVKGLVRADKLPPVKIKGRTGMVEPYEVLDLLEQEQVSDDKKNLRRHDRLDVTLFAIYRGATSSRMYQGSIKNISRGGVQLSTREIFPLGTDVTLSFSLPNGQKLTEVGGRVTHVQQLTDDKGKEYSKLGIEFTRCTDEDRERIVHAWQISSWRGGALKKI
ncbi:MAG: GAF domain-containing protein [Nitrospirae bacterium]|nr:MAG: GAF domain-containing protein [Nitrospirota bacterium]